LLLALALEGSSPPGRAELLALITESQNRSKSRETVPGERTFFVERVRSLFQLAQAFEKAEKLIEKYRARAEAVADEVEPAELRELLYFMVDTILDRQAPEPEPEPPALLQLSL
jgi:geranylgeranyl pyrophosphate synthase